MSGSETFRRKAENLFEQESVDNLKFSFGDDSDVLLHELALSRIELGLINETLEKKDSAIEELQTEIDIRKEAENRLQSSEKRLRALAQKLIHGQEAEKERISKELHDNIGSSLIAVRYALEGKAMEISRAGCDRKINLEEIFDMLNTIANDTMRISKSVRPMALEHLDIESVLKSYCEHFQQTCSDSLSFKYDVELQEEHIPEEMKILLYRVVQEGLTNVHKHSGADRVRLSLRETDGHVVLDLEDNGRGLDMETDWTDRGLGLESMKERAEFLGGDLHILSESGQGVRIQAQWPIY